MTRLLFLLMLATLASSLHAETYAQREDVQAFVADMNTRHGFDVDALSALFHRTKPIAVVIKA